MDPKDRLLIKQAVNLPMIAVDNLVIFPDTLLHFDISEKLEVLALDHAMRNNQLIFVAARHSGRNEVLKTEDIETVGTVCRVKQVVKMPDGMMRVLVEGLYRARIAEIQSEEPYFDVLLEVLNDTAEDLISSNRYEALKRRLVLEVERYQAANHAVNQGFLIMLENIDALSELADAVAANVQFKMTDRQRLLNTVSAEERIELLIGLLARETEIKKLDNEIEKRVVVKMSDEQREYHLREQMRVIQEALGDKDGVGLEIRNYREKLTRLGVSDEVFKKCDQELERLAKMQFGNPEANVIRTYVSTICELPWNTVSKENLSLDNARKILNRDHWGLEKIKERILEYLAVKKITNSMAGPILCLVGPPGVGKTSIARSIAESLGRKYVRISLGGIRDEADIRGHRKTYIGAMPGRIMQAMKQVGTKNPLMLFDEIDKMGSDYRGDPSAALLEVLDSEQNMKFRDHYLEVDFDLSQVLFVATANTLETVPRPLLDRMEIIELTGYTSEEKQQIAKRHLLPKQREKHGLSAQNFKVTAGALREMIDFYTRESGVRGLERTLAKLCRKADLALAENDAETVRVTEKNLHEFLGKRRFSYDTIGKKDEVGVVTGLAWTQVGGDTLSVEVNIMPGSGKTELTGQLGDVMQESAKAAISYVRANADALSIASDFYKNKDIHIHVPEGATPKDGPSAGITIATALVSALSGHAVHRDVAMTGEITLRGRVLPIGGLKEKTLAAFRAGIKTVVIPADNEKDVDELEGVVKENLRIVPVHTMHEVLQTALLN